eukprot:TRINITY_DN1048_c0_g1_i1.p1 TRINITY_DN1048_c0_g1~~TRINITY_DN1048_c0_g1_i1.p1  ORF type:complete len:577 (-),score=104.27 TRINITY_DN1048_c0_g1_i1:178-1854(-)
MDPNDSWSQPRKTFKLRKSLATAPSTGSNTKQKSISQELLNAKKPDISDNDRPVMTATDSFATPSPTSRNISTSNSNKRRNPFGNVENVTTSDDKRRRLSDNYFHDNNKATNSPDMSPSAVSRKATAFTVVADRGGGGVQASNGLGSDYRPLPELPMDWSLKNRVTFVSSRPWLWGEHVSSVQVASSLTSNVRCLEITKGKHCLDTSATSKFYSHTYYWQFPTLPGVNLFPRYRQSRLDKISLGAELFRAANSEWIQSLQSVYQLVKAGQCPYFYVCTQLFTCLFRAAGISGSQQILALISPTTSGIRAALTRADVEFTLPLRKVGGDDGDGADGGETADDDCCKPDKDGASDILESLGIEANSLPGFAGNAAGAKNTTKSDVILDGRSDSLVFVEGVECQSLLNYLLNAKLSQGPNELPPTILAPVAFPGATLKSLKVKENVVGGKGGQPKTFQIDVTGPILPHTVQSLTQLSATYSQDFTLRTRTQEDTFGLAAFTLPPDSQAQPAFASANLNDCGLSEKMLAKISLVEAIKDDKVIRSIHVKQNSYKVLEEAIKE